MKQGSIILHLRWKGGLKDEHRVRRRVRFLGCAWNIFYWLFSKLKNDQRACIIRSYCSVYGDEIKKKWLQVLFHQDNSHVRYRDRQNRRVKVLIYSSRTLFARFSPIEWFSLFKSEENGLAVFSSNYTRSYNFQLGPPTKRKDSIQLFFIQKIRNLSKHRNSTPSQK